MNNNEEGHYSSNKSNSIKDFSKQFNEGIKSAFISEIAFRQELLLFIVCVSILFVLDVSNLERAVMISSLFLVLIVEIVNTAFETTIGRISSEQQLGSAAVFLSLINFLITWMIILTG
ncbi:diacylglycerol kinase [Wolbachia endosymbiont of Glossina morsitans morsitans]|uniref:diacylglycerol kinase n=1 Tax=Wolbachia endosymbiont of Glossina morsitans morsitans TaxID=1150948 RepID=UPI00045B0BAC|nr:diacylglycerol kinase [Wolbachia endosymbiont of Glossina morsitans morsitans]KDB19213.1 diacylglycerol kinase [Wolbachia endosymbiont of Glossina morsitans morsitans]